jgi:hypothetical protein
MGSIALLCLFLQDPEFVADGARYKITRGDAYRWAKDRWVFVQNLYDPDFYAKNYVEPNGRIFRIADGKHWEVGRSFRSSFEGAKSLRDLIGEKHRWTEFTLQSPKTPTVQDYVALRRRILQGDGDFLDNRIEIATVAGRRGLRFHSVAKTKEMVCSKASIGTEFVHFPKGDDFWFAAWYYVEDGMPLSILDLESSWIAGSPGPRVFLDEEGCAYVELKFAEKPSYRPTGKNRIPVPRRKWVRFQLHLGISETDGAIELWQDGAKTLDTRGRTLPLADTVLQSLEVGISANDRTTTLFVADVVVSDRRID